MIKSSCSVLTVMLKGVLYHLIFCSMLYNHYEYLYITLVNLTGAATCKKPVSSGGSVHTENLCDNKNLTHVTLLHFI